MRLGFLYLFLAVTLWGGEVPVVVREVQEMDAFQLQASAKVDKKLVPECSALWASQQNPGVFWTLSDSGNKIEIIPMRRDGSLAWGTKGVTITGAKNYDWEALTGDADGNMVVADVGNNISNRRQLNLYFFKEPSARNPEVTEVKTIPFIWPDQKEFPDPDLKHDCESIFKIRGNIYFLTKHRRDTFTELWRIDIPQSNAQANLTKVAQFDAKGMVTDASVSPDGKCLAILTYRAVWVITLPVAGENIFNGPMLYAPLSPPVLSWQIEGCAWLDAQTLLVGSEQGDLFKIPLSALKPVK
jgi:hypothetical protein